MGGLVLIVAHATTRCGSCSSSSGRGRITRKQRRVVIVLTRVDVLGMISTQLRRIVHLLSRCPTDGTAGLR
uniref:Putative secreted protein n=1 Tax=Anopheles triannulatus TaxID=58253 RepID=A0A2M4B1J2_9DIPT